MSKKIKVIILFAIVFSTCFLFWSYTDKNDRQEGVDISFLYLHHSEVEYKVEVADTQEKRIKGLSKRQYLPIDTVLLFVFDESKKHGIWMKDMLFSIDIIWLDEDYYVVDYREDVSPVTFPDVFYPKEVARHVVETNRDFIRIHGVEIGDKFNFY